jgi:Rrf2 family protein
MKLSTKSVYALKVMLDFAEHKNSGYARLKDVADRQGISKAYLEQIMVLLNKADFFNTARGYLGGYQLAEEPSNYTVADIVRVTEGSLSLVNEDCADDGGDMRTANMANSVWGGLEEVLTEYLGSITLQDILDENREDGGIDYFI